VKYLLDTDHMSILQRRTGAEHAALTTRLALQAPADVGVSIVSFQEQVLGVHTFINRARTAADLVRGYNLLWEVQQAFAAATVLPFDAAAAAVLGLQAQRLRVATMDLRIAAVALANGLILLTRNVGDFSRVPGLVTDDWTK
jgi:tRNA(fMet)-specific endonuclease VapC